LSRELETGVIDRTEIAPGVITARTLTRVREGACLASTVNMNDEEETISLPTVDLEQCDTEISGLHVGTINTQTEDRLCELRKKLRAGHLNDEERSVTTMCEDYSDIFHLPGDRLTTTTAVEHVIPTPSIDPCRGIASRNCRIPEALKGELNKQ
jgi:hypothetical protein